MFTPVAAFPTLPNMESVFPNNPEGEQGGVKEGFGVNVPVEVGVSAGVTVPVEVTVGVCVRVDVKVRVFEMVGDDVSVRVEVIVRVYV
jgi:hypothetical protein